MLASRSSSARLVAAIFIAAASAGAIAACSSAAPANFPDRDAVVAAQAVWCDELGRVLGGGKWEHLATCKAALPTASPGYLRQGAPDGQRTKVAQLPIAIAHP